MEIVEIKYKINIRWKTWITKITWNYLRKNYEIMNDKICNTVKYVLYIYILNNIKKYKNNNYKIIINITIIF